MATTYVTTDSAKLYKKKGSNAVTTVKKGQKLSISKIDGNWAQLAANSSKINNKNVGSLYISKSKISKSTSKNKNKKKNNKHAAHDKHTYKGKTILNTYVRANCSDSSYKTSGKFYNKGTKVKVVEICKTNNLYKVTGVLANGKTHTGWVSAPSVKLSNNALARMLQNAKQKMAQQAKNQSRRQANKVVSDILDTKSFDAKKDLEKYAENLLIRDSNGILGMPYQFMPSVDYRLSNMVSFGRKYTERIATKMPLILFTPGKPDFMATFKKSDRMTVIQALISSFNKGKKTDLNKLLKGSGRYYTFDFAYAEYWPYVNAMLRFCAVVLGIGKVMHSNAGTIKTYNNKSNILGGILSKVAPKKSKKKLRNYQWQHAVNTAFTKFFNSPEYVAFYLDSETSVTESIDNSTTTSQIGDAVNSASSLSKEIQFLAGPIAGVRIDNIVKEDTFEKAQSRIYKDAEKYLHAGALVNKLGEMFSAIGKGGHILFPELWNDSEFTKSYNISLKLRTPDGDKISWYLNICVPLIHILALAAPHSIGPNGYSSPFLVRAFYKGIFNCDMGLITSVDITKGKEGAWSVDGLPTEVDVTIGLKDLYGAFSITNGNGYKFFQNTALVDYLCTSCGVNINKIELARLGEMYMCWTYHKFADYFPNQWLKIQQGASKLSANAYNKIIKNGGV